MEEEMKEMCLRLRKAIEEIKSKVKALKKHGDLKSLKSEDSHGEAVANIMLTYRHLEDARMRLGKCVQALDGGTSCYPR